MILKIIKLSLSIFLLFVNCNGEDVKGKIAIEYSGDWSLSIIDNYNETSLNGSGNWERIFVNPETLTAIATKLDSSYNKLILYIYEDERIVSGASTREPGDSISVEYDFPY